MDLLSNFIIKSEILPLVLPLMLTRNAFSGFRSFKYKQIHVLENDRSVGNDDYMIE